MTDTAVFGETADIDVITDEMWSGEQITQAISELGDYYRYTDVSTLAGGEYDPEAVEAFARLAKSLKLPVHVGYSLTIRRELPHDKLRAAALQRLRDKAERGEIRPAYLHGRDN